MKAKEYLLQYGRIQSRLRLIDSNIDKLRRDLRNLDDISVSSPWPDGQPHGTKTSDPTGSKAVKLADSINVKRDQLRKELEDYEYQQIMERSKLWSKGIEITEKLGEIMLCDDINAKTYHDILQMRYIQNALWEEIAIAIGYTFRHTIRLHGEALKKMEDILNE